MNSKVLNNSKLKLKIGHARFPLKPSSYQGKIRKYVLLGQFLHHVSETELQESLY